MTVGLCFVVGFLLGCCVAGTATCCFLLKQVLKKKSNND